MADLFAKLTAPDGRPCSQPLGLFIGIMPTSGQICTATSRIRVHEGFPEPVTLEIGQPFLGMRIRAHKSQKQPQGHITCKVFIEPAVSEGATPMTSGLFRFANSAGKCHWPNDNIQGGVFWSRSPVVVISSFWTEQEAVARANNTSYGFGAAVFTQDLDKAREAAGCHSLQLWSGSTAVKQSGIGRELGEAGLEAETQVKAVHINTGNCL